MPTYEYTCGKCSHRFEETLRMNDRAKPTKRPCPGCGEKGLIEQTFSTPPNAVDPIRLGTSGSRGIKMDNGFKEVISKIKKSHPKNTMPDY